jgi:hypothetical protein
MRHALLLLSLMAVLLPIEQSFTYRYRMIAGTKVACRSEANSAANLRTRLLIGDVFLIREQSQDGLWYRGSFQGLDDCWVSAHLTVEFSTSDPGPAVLAAVDRMLQVESATFEDLVETDRLFHSNTFENSPASSGLLQYRRLALIERAVKSKEARLRDAVLRDPWKASWIELHRDVLGVDYFGGGWYVRAEPYWKIYDAHKDAWWADELAWTASQHGYPTDECYSDCVLQLLSATSMQYWARHPNGASIDKAIQAGTSMAKYAASLACYDRNPARPNRPSDSPVPQALVQQIRESLVPISVPGKADLLAFLAEAEQKCSEPR